MHSKTKRRSVSTLVALLHLLMSLAWVVPATSANAQGVDSEPPAIDFEAVSKGFVTDSQVFTATVTDDNRVEVVTLYYRFDDEALYASRNMSPLGSTNIYTTTIETGIAPADASVIQYYMEALDTAGNRTLQGFAFDPIERQLVARTTVAAGATDAPVAAESMSTTRKIVYGVLGLVVVGAIASSAGGGGGSDAPSVPVTVNVQELP